MENHMSDETLIKWISQNLESWDIICETGVEANLNEISDISNKQLAVRSFINVSLQKFQLIKNRNVVKSSLF